MEFRTDYAKSRYHNGRSVLHKLFLNFPCSNLLFSIGRITSLLDLRAVVVVIES